MDFKSARISIRLVPGSSPVVTLATVGAVGEVTYRSIQPADKGDFKDKLRGEFDSALQHQAHYLAQRAAEAAKNAEPQVGEYTHKEG
jgi:hypothetical protein